MLKNNYDVAMIMQRRKIHAGLSIYVPALGIEGKYSEDEGIFYALDGTSYEVLDEFIDDFDDDFFEDDDDEEAPAKSEDKEETTED